jgi:twitching motility protein PilT
MADSLVAVVCQRLQYREEIKMQVPECEILVPTHAAKNFIRRGEFFKIGTVMETGADQGMFTYQRYRNWLDTRKTWHRINERDGDDNSVGEMTPPEGLSAAPIHRPPPIAPGTPNKQPVAPRPGLAAGAPRSKDGTLEIQPEEGGLQAIISQLKAKP